MAFGTVNINPAGGVIQLTGAAKLWEIGFFATQPPSTFADSLLVVPEPGAGVLIAVGLGPIFLPRRRGRRAGPPR